MTVTTTEILTVNGVVLNTLAKNVSSLAGRLRTPAFRTENIKVPGRHGSLRTPNKKFDENSIILPMWVVGSDDNGMIPTGSNKRKEFYKRVDELTKLFKGTNEELDLQHTLPDGTVRQIFGDAMEVFDFTTDASPKGLFSVNIVAYYPFWQDLLPITQKLKVVAAYSTATQFALTTAPIEDMVYEIAGPWISPRLTFADGSYVAYNATIPAGQSLVIDSGEWELTGKGGLIPDYSKIEHDGTDAYWAAMPAKSQRVDFGGSGRTTATLLTLTGRRKYLVG